MRDLRKFELSHVSGAGAGGPPSPSPSKSKANNGFGNAGNDPAPGRSGNTSPDKLADSVR